MGTLRACFVVAAFATVARCFFGGRTLACFVIGSHAASDLHLRLSRQGIDGEVPVLFKRQTGEDCVVSVSKNSGGGVIGAITGKAEKFGKVIVKCGLGEEPVRKALIYAARANIAGGDRAKACLMYTPAFLEDYLQDGKPVQRLFLRGKWVEIHESGTSSKSIQNFLTCKSRSSSMTLGAAIKARALENGEAVIECKRKFAYKSLLSVMTANDMLKDDGDNRLIWIKVAVFQDKYTDEASMRVFCKLRTLETGDDDMEELEAACFKEVTESY